MTSTTEHHTDSATHFFDRRKSWFEVGAMQREDRNGWDIVLRIDGTYFGEEHVNPKDMVEYWRDRITEVLKHEGIEQR